MATQDHPLHTLQKVIYRVGIRVGQLRTLDLGLGGADGEGWGQLTNTLTTAYTTAQQPVRGWASCPAKGKR